MLLVKHFEHLTLIYYASTALDVIAVAVPMRKD